MIVVNHSNIGMPIMSDSLRKNPYTSSCNVGRGIHSHTTFEVTLIPIRQMTKNTREVMSISFDISRNLCPIWSNMIKYDPTQNKIVISHQPQPLMGLLKAFDLFFVNASEHCSENRSWFQLNRHGAAAACYVSVLYIFVMLHYVILCNII